MYLSNDSWNTYLEVQEEKLEVAVPGSRTELWL